MSKHTRNSEIDLASHPLNNLLMQTLKPILNIASKTLIDHAKRRGFKILNIGISQREIEALEAQLESSIAGLEDGEYLEDEE